MENPLPFAALTFTRCPCQEWGNPFALFAMTNPAAVVCAMFTSSMTPSFTAPVTVIPETDAGRREPSIANRSILGPGTPFTPPSDTEITVEPVNPAVGYRTVPMRPHSFGSHDPAPWNRTPAGTVSGEDVTYTPASQNPSPAPLAMAFSHACNAAVSSVTPSPFAPPAKVVLRGLR